MNGRCAWPWGAAGIATDSPSRHRPASVVADGSCLPCAQPTTGQAFVCHREKKRPESNGKFGSSPLSCCR